MSRFTRLSFTIIIASITVIHTNFANNQNDSTKKLSKPQQIIEMLESLSPAENEELALFISECERQARPDNEYKKMFDCIEEEDTLSGFNKLMRSIDNSIISPIAKVAIALYCLNFYYTKVTPWIKNNFKENETMLTKVTEAIMGVWFLEKIKDCAKRLEAGVTTSLRGVS